MNSVKRKELASKKIKKVRAGCISRKRYIKLTCKVCHQEFKVHTNNSAIYTDKVKQNWRCILCK